MFNLTYGCNCFEKLFKTSSFSAVGEGSVNDKHDTVQDGQPSLGQTSVDVRWLQHHSIEIIVGHYSRCDEQSSTDQHVEHVLKMWQSSLIKKNTNHGIFKRKTNFMDKKFKQKIN